MVQLDGSAFFVWIAVKSWIYARWSQKFVKIMTGRICSSKNLLITRFRKLTYCGYKHDKQAGDETTEEEVNVEKCH